MVNFKFYNKILNFTIKKRWGWEGGILYKVCLEALSLKPRILYFYNLQQALEILVSTMVSLFKIKDHSFTQFLFLAFEHILCGRPWLSTGNPMMNEIWSLLSGNLVW